MTIPRTGYLLLSAIATATLATATLAAGMAYAESGIERESICRGAVADGEKTASDAQPRRYAPDRKGMFST